MSRRMPPTPVAAPSKGSTALGWLCDSTLNAHASPSPTRHGARVLARPQHQPRALGRQRLQQPPRVLVAAVLGPHQREDGELDLVRLAPHLLDDQVVLGVGEPELAVLAHAGTRAADSNSFSPSAEPVSSVDRVLGVRHQPDDVARVVRDARDVPRRAVEVLARGVAQHDLAVGLELVQHRVRRVVAAGRVLGGDRQRLADRARARPRGRRVDDLQRHLPAGEPQRRVRAAARRATAPPRTAPGTRCRCPSTSPPRRAKRSTSPITGAKRAIAPTRR